MQRTSYRKSLFNLALVSSFVASVAACSGGGPSPDAGADSGANDAASDGGGLQQPDYPLRTTVGSCEVRWRRWGTTDAHSGMRLASEGSLVWFSETSAGRLWVIALSGATGEEVSRIDLAPAQTAAPTLRPVGDADGDSVPDVVVAYSATETTSGGSSSGSGGTTSHVELWSTRARARLWEHHESLGGLFSCCGVARVGDRDGDALDDIVVSNPLHIGERGELQPSPLSILSLRTGREISTVNPPADADYSYGERIVEASDINGDGTRDWFLTDAIGPRSHVGFGAVYAVDGRTGAPLWRTVGSSETVMREERPWLLGGGALSASDVDGDGVSDVLASAHNAAVGENIEAGKLLALSGRDGSQLWVIDGPSAGEHLGASNAFGGNLDGDQTPAVVVGVPGSDDLVAFNGRIEVRARRDAQLLISVESQAVADCIDPANPDPACMTDAFAQSLVVLPSPPQAIDIVTSAIGARIANAGAPGVVMALRCRR